MPRLVAIRDDLPLSWKPVGLALLGLAVVGLSCLPALAQDSQPENNSLQAFDLHIAFTRSSFLGVNEADAMAAFKVFTKTVGRRRGYDITPSVRVFDDMNALAAEIARDSQDLLIIDSWEYLTLLPGTNMQAEFSTIEQGVTLEDYVLLVKAGSAFSALPDLKGRRVLVLESSSANTGRYWLSTELMDLGVESPDAFFGQFEFTHKTSQVVLPVFFGQADACVVDRSGFNIMKELNPQVGKSLLVASHSEPLLDTIICVRKRNWDSPQFRLDLIDALKELNSDPGGQQILSLFKFEGMTPFKQEHLNTVRALRARHDAHLTAMSAENQETEAQ